MSRPLRIEFPDAWYHVINRARLGQEAFPAGEDYLGFIELLMDASDIGLRLIGDLSLLRILKSLYVITQKRICRLYKAVKHLLSG